MECVAPSVSSAPQVFYPVCVYSTSLRPPYLFNLVSFSPRVYPQLHNFTSYLSGQATSNLPVPSRGKATFKLSIINQSSSISRTPVNTFHGNSSTDAVTVRARVLTSDRVLCKGEYVSGVSVPPRSEDRKSSKCFASLIICLIHMLARGGSVARVLTG